MLPVLRCRRRLEIWVLTAEIMSGVKSSQHWPKIQPKDVRGMLYIADVTVMDELHCFDIFQET